MSNIQFYVGRNKYILKHILIHRDCHRTVTELSYVRNRIHCVYEIVYTKSYNLIRSILE